MRAIIRRLGCVTVLAVGVGSPALLRAQEFQLGIDFATVIPRGGFKQNINNNGYGVGGQFVVGLGRSPFLAGVDAGSVTYGSETRDEPLSTNIPGLRVEVETDNNIAWTHFLLRAQVRRGDVRPYADGLVGFKYLSTTTTIREDSTGEEIASTTNFSDFTFSYGLGGGAQVRLVGALFLDGKVRYLRGSQAEYLRRGSIRQENGRVVFDVLSSRTDVVTVQVGVTFRF